MGDPDGRPLRTVVLGLGNALMADDGVGLYALSHLQDDWFTPPDVEFVDGGTWGLRLLPIVDNADRLLVLDAVDSGSPPGTLSELRGEQIPIFLERTKLSPHQVDLRDVLALCELRGRSPAEVVVLGIQPQRVEMSTELSPAVRDQLDGLVTLAGERLRGWGINCFRHEAAHA
ncbi:MAG: HyaD/HybD family hydrogenase maturation endopeptidase [Gemmatimonadaceae bacterium]